MKVCRAMCDEAGRFPSPTRGGDQRTAQGLGNPTVSWEEGELDFLSLLSSWLQPCLSVGILVDFWGYNDPRWGEGSSFLPSGSGDLQKYQGTQGS